VYAWSVFVPSLVGDHGLSTTQTQAVFGTTIAVFTAVMIYSGRLVERRGPRLPALIAGALYCAGYLIAAVSGAHVLGLFAGVGVLAGAGIGMGYVCPLTVSIKWFPQHKGLVTGITVAGFGGGAVVLSAAVSQMSAAGVTVPSMFLIIGLTYGVAIAAAGLLLSTPATSTAEHRPVSVRHVVHGWLFWALVLGMFAGTFAGLLVIGNLKPLGLDEGFSETAATAAISALALGNAVGRVTWGWLHDRFGRALLPVSLVALAAAVVALRFAGSDLAFIVSSAAVGFGFGSCFVLYAAEIADKWTSAAVGAVYPLVFLAYGVSGVVGPVTGGRLFDATGSYDLAIVISAVLTSGSALGFVFMWRRSTARMRVPHKVRPERSDG